MLRARSKLHGGREVSYRPNSKASPRSLGAQCPPARRHGSCVVPLNVCAKTDNSYFQALSFCDLTQPETRSCLRLSLTDFNDHLD